MHWRRTWQPTPVFLPGESQGRGSLVACRLCSGTELDMTEATYVKVVYCHLAYLTYVQSTSCEMPGWMKHKLQSKLPGEISITSDMQMISPLWQKAKRKGTEEPHDESERGSEKVGLKLNI